MSARHAAADARRPVSLLLAVATVLGIWFGLRAPEVSPVTPSDPAGTMQIVVDDQGSQREGPR